MCPDAASAEDLMTAEHHHVKSITVCMSINPGLSHTIILYDIREDVCNDSLDLQSNSCRYSVVSSLLRPHLASLCERRSAISSLGITVCMSINPGLRHQIVVYDIREFKCNDSCDLQQGTYFMGYVTIFVRLAPNNFVCKISM